MLLVFWGQILQSISPQMRELNRATPVKSNNLTNNSETVQDRIQVSTVFTNKKPLMGFWSLPKSLMLCDLECPYDHHFKLFHAKWQLLKPTTSNSLKLHPYCRWQKCGPWSLKFWQYMAYDDDTRCLWGSWISCNLMLCSILFLHSQAFNELFFAVLNYVAARTLLLCRCWQSVFSLLTNYFLIASAFSHL